MLVLSRKVEESIFIGDDIEILVSSVDVNRGSVKIAIKAPKELTILRSELKDREGNKEPNGNKW